MSNPFEVPDSTDTSSETVASHVSKKSPASTAAQLAFCGAILGAVFCSAGYLAIVSLLEWGCVPPLHSPANYGQFGVLLLTLGFFGLVYGASFGLIPYIGFRGWVAVFGLATVFLMPSDLSNAFDASDVTYVAMIIAGLTIVVLAAVTSGIVHR